MKARFLIIIFIALLILVAFFFYRAQPSRLEVTLSISTSLFQNKGTSDGNGYINNINCSALKWPNFSNDNYEITGTRGNPITLPVPVKFQLILLLNHAEKDITFVNSAIGGSYTYIIDCYFDNIKSGTYTLTAFIKINGTTDNSNTVTTTIVIP